MNREEIVKIREIEMERRAIGTNCCGNCRTARDHRSLSLIDGRLGALQCLSDAKQNGDR
jgi:hypothetical protein